MELHVIGLVLLAAVLHAGWNALVKTGEDRVLTMAVLLGVTAVAAGAALPFVTPPAPESWIYLILSVVLHGGYFFFLLQAYRVGDLSHVYPVARGAAPLLVALGAAIFAGEVLEPIELIGLVLASLAIASFAFEGGLAALKDPRPFLYGLATAAFISSYTVADGLGVRASGSTAGFIAWLFVVDGLPLLVYALITRRGRIGPYLRANWKSGLVGGVMCGVAYALIIWALNLGAMAFVSALRETSVVFAVLIGSVFLGEPFGGRRIAAAAVVVAGIAVMNLAG